MVYIGGSDVLDIGPLDCAARHGAARNRVRLPALGSGVPKEDCTDEAAVRGDQALEGAGVKDRSGHQLSAASAREDVHGALAKHPGRSCQNHRGVFYPATGDAGTADVGPADVALAAATVRTASPSLIEHLS